MSSSKRTATIHHDDVSPAAASTAASTGDEPSRPSTTSLIASPVLLSALNYAVAFAPVLIVMYVFSIMRSELSRIQARLDAMSVRVKNAPTPSPAANPYEDFQRFMAVPPQEPPQPPPPAQRREYHHQYPSPPQHAPPPQQQQLDAAAAAEHRAVPVVPPPSWPQQLQAPQQPQQLQAQQQPQQPHFQAPSQQPQQAPPQMHVLSMINTAEAPTTVVQLIPQMQPEGTKKSLPRLEELK